jgi:hypothetical protein
MLCLAYIPYLGAGTGVTGRLTVGRNIRLRLRYRCLEVRISSVDWAQLSRLYLKTETESSRRTVLF